VIDPNRIPSVDVLEAERRRGAPAEANEATGTDAGGATPLLVDVREPGEFAEVLAAIRNGVAYANVHSAKFAGGEIRGQLRRDWFRHDD